MTGLTFRFHGQLNDFLPAHQRGRRFARALRASSSVKDAIEVIGVPHPEVDVVIVNGETVDFTHRVPSRFMMVLLAALVAAGDGVSAAVSGRGPRRYDRCSRGHR